MIRLKKNGEMISAVGTMIYAKSTGRFLFGLRNPKSTYGGRWDLFGGKMEQGENAEQCIRRELSEEISVISKFISLMPVDIYQSKDKNFKYITCLMIVETEFTPILNNEHIGFAWVDKDNWSSLLLHPGTFKTLKQSSKFINKLILI